MEQLSNDLREEIIQAVEQIEISQTDAWDQLDILSTHTTVDSIEVDPDGIIIGDRNFSGVANVYVSLQYGSGGDDGFSTSDSFIAEFEGVIEDGHPTVTSFTVDTTSFYAQDGGVD